MWARCGGVRIIGRVFKRFNPVAWAYFQSHAPRGFRPIQNGGELAALYCWLFLYIAAAGPGKWSIDALRGRRTSSRN